MVTVTNGTDAIELCKEKNFDLVLLDEQMPGLSGLETLQQLKELHPSLPIVMVTKSEEENIMEQAIGQKIADYLIKPVNPNQILLTLKKNIHRHEIENEVTQNQYQQNFQQIAMQILDCKTWKDWADVYKRLVHWELELTATDSSMTEMLKMQKEDANNGFAKFIKRNYLDWIDQLEAHSPCDDQRPMLSPEVFKQKVFPALNQGEKVFLIVLDNFRYDQWRIIAQDISKQFDIDEDLYYSILPTATQYARNAIFSGLMPNKIAAMFPDLWVDEDEEEGKNLNEEPLICSVMPALNRKWSGNWQVMKVLTAASRCRGSAILSSPTSSSNWPRLTVRSSSQPTTVVSDARNPLRLSATETRIPIFAINLARTWPMMTRAFLSSIRPRKPNCQHRISQRPMSLLGTPSSTEASPWRRLSYPSSP